MRTIVLAATATLALSSVILAACGQPTNPTPAAPTVPAAEQAAPGTLDTRQRASVDGWETGSGALSILGSTLPPFALSQANGTELTQENLRGRWTIIGFATSDADRAEAEKDYVAALNSAADQDPDLDFVAINPKATTPPPATPPAWPTLYDETDYAKQLDVTVTPSYLLIGPDLTVEGYRGALVDTPDDGIKSVIRGVAEIRKQVAAPQ
ncbi:MAG TPA: hypothetical protein PLN33_06325 [Hyphomonadaceae bacterium]|jgi:hypothetical protein|nr:hypothetical protein [Hyphomonadaceae bacterium]HPN05151.1 hypothetical protein [Hyphomonadaceae bacterium]